MQLVVIARWGAPLESELPALASLLGVAPYDLRLRIAGVPPVVVARTDEARAREMVQALRARGHGVVVCDPASVPGLSDHCVPRDFAFGPSALGGTDATGRPFELPYVEVSALVRASEIASAEQSRTTTVKKLDISRAVMSGGLLPNKKVEHTVRTESETREQVLYAFQRGTGASFLFRETVLHYQGLGAARVATSMQNFLVFVQELRQRSPRAFYDQRFLGQKRKAGVTSVTGRVGDRRVESSNASENDLGAYLLLLAHEQGQL